MGNIDVVHVISSGAFGANSPNTNDETWSCVSYVKLLCPMLLTMLSFAALNHTAARLSYTVREHHSSATSSY